MNLQAKLTLWYVLLAVVIVGSISGIDLVTNMTHQFDATLKSADTLTTSALIIVKSTLNSQLHKPLREALRDPSLQPNLVSLLSANKAILEIAVVDAHTHDVVADSAPERLGGDAGPYPDFRTLVEHTGWREKWKVLRGSEKDYYQLEQQLGSSDKPVLLVRVIVSPALIRGAILPTMQRNAEVALISVIAAICITFLFSA